MSKKKDWFGLRSIFALVILFSLILLEASSIVALDKRIARRANPVSLPEEAQIEIVLLRLGKALEKNDMNLFMLHISKDFTNGKGLTRKEVAQEVQRILDRFKSRREVFRVLFTDVRTKKNPNGFDVTCSINLRGISKPEEKVLSGIKKLKEQETWRFKKEEGTWKVAKFEKLLSCLERIQTP